MKRALVLTAAAALLVGCATTTQQPARNPMVTIRNYPAAEALAKFSQGCLQTGGNLEQSTQTQAICAKPMDDSMRSTFMRALLTPANSTNPVYRARFSVIENGGSTTLHVEPYIEYQNAYGQTTKMAYTNAEDLNNLQASFDRLKAEWEAAHP